MRSPGTRRERQEAALMLTAVVVIAPLVALYLAQLAAARPLDEAQEEEAQAIGGLVVIKPEEHSERLLASLNESLGRFLQTASGDFAADEEDSEVSKSIDSNSSNNNQSGKQLQDQQSLQVARERSVALKKISCSKISLVVMAQRALNASASSNALKKLAECRRDNLLDLELLEALERSTTTTMTAAEIELAPETGRLRRRPESDNADNRTRRQHRQQRQQQQRDKTVRQQLELCPPEARNCSNGIELTGDSETKTLHLGAKLAIVLVAAVLLLVCVATLVDCCCRHRSGQATRLKERRTGSSRALGGRRGLSSGNKDDNRNRSARDLNASRFFLDLGPQAAKLRDYRSLSISSNSSSNLFCSSNSVASSSAPILSNNHQRVINQQGQQHQLNNQHQINCAGQYESNLQLHLSQIAHRCERHNQSSRASSSLSQCDDSADNNHCYSRAAKRDRLSKQILLAFSLRRTANQIFERQHEGPDDDRQESVDWLHGLRFFSMIWVIVIHSYNFALRWMFFSNTSTLDGIYKSAASQFIANGSFACDSFFFVGGFLLPYLALRPVGAAPKGGANAAADDYGNETTTTAAAEEEALGEEANSHVRQQVSAASGELEEQLSESSAWFCCACNCAGGSLTGSCRQRSACTKQQQHSSNLCGLEECPGATSTTVTTATCLAANCCHCFKHTQTLCGGVNFSNEQTSNNRVNCSLAQHRNLATNTNELGGRQHNQQPVYKLNSAPAIATEDLSDSNQTNRPKLRGKQSGFWSGHDQSSTTSQFSWRQCLANVLRRYVRMMPLMMAIIALCANLLRYLGDGPVWQESTMMYDDWCRRNWWVNALFLHNFVNRENMCLSHSWYSAVDFQLFLCGQMLLLALCRYRRLGLTLLLALIFGSPLITMVLTLRYHLPAVPLISSVNEQTMNIYYGEIYIKPYSRASPYLIGILLAYLMRTTSLGQWRLKKWQVALGWFLAIGLLLAIVLAMQPAMNGHTPSELESALYSGWSRPLWACAASWIIFACITRQAGFIGTLLGSRCFVPLSKLTYPAFLIHPIIMASFYGTRQASFQFSHYLMLYLILGNIVITYASAFVLAALVELPCLSIERAISRRLFRAGPVR